MGGAERFTVTTSLQDRGSAAQPRAQQIEPAEFYATIHPGVAGGDLAVALVTPGPNGQPSVHHPQPEGTDATWLAGRARGTAYFTPSEFRRSELGRYKGRSRQNAVRCRVLYLDIEGSEEKGGYAGARSVAAAVGAAVQKTRLYPNLLVNTGSGGMHLYWVLEEAMVMDVWLPLFRSFAGYFGAAGLKYDSACVADPARIMRAPGSVHQKTGKSVQAYRWRVEPYTVAELSQAIGYAAAEQTAEATADASRYAGAAAVNDDVLGRAPMYSAAVLAERCPAFGAAVAEGGVRTKYPVWVLALTTAKNSEEGATFAHEASQAHPGYDAREVDRKLESLAGGPANCESWASAYGAGGPCETCEHRGKIKNPVSLALKAGGSLAGEASATASELEPEIARLNTRFALARVGGKMLAVDFCTPQVTARGVQYRLGFLELGGFRAMHAGEYLRRGGRPRPLAEAWLSHSQRRQYEGVVYAPGDELPPKILNLWQGFSVEPCQGDVSPWLRLLGALIPSAAERDYALRWFAWKVQNPGGVPDTLLVLTGTKGTGKNSLVEPLLDMFAPHSMLADDPELIAGRFTWHLMSLSFAVLDEAVFVGDPRQADRIKSRVTAKTMYYEQKGADPVAGVNRCAYVMLTNHAHAWAATTDERRAVVIEAGTGLRGNLQFWTEYHGWLREGGVAVLLDYLQKVDVSGFNPRAIPRGEALRRQTELTALRDPAAAWWFQCLTEGVIRWREGGTDRVALLPEDAEAVIDRTALRLSYEQSAAARSRTGADWASVARKLAGWVGPHGVRKVRAREGEMRAWREVLAPLPSLKSAFTEATHITVEE